MSSQIRFEIPCAKFDYSVNTFMDRNPYYMIEIQRQTIKGQVCYGGDKNPSGQSAGNDHTITLTKGLVGTVCIKFYSDKDLIALCERPIADLIKMQGATQTYELTKKKLTRSSCGTM